MSTYIKALIIQRNSNVNLNGGGADLNGAGDTIIGVGVGATEMIPCHDKATIEGDFWAVPVSDGVLSGFIYRAYNPAEVVSSKPSSQAFAVVKIAARKSADWWYAVGTSIQYVASCEVCCGDTPVLMPSTVPILYPCQVMCKFNDQTNKKYIAVLPLPTLAAGKKYLPVGSLNGVALTSGAVAGYTDTAALVTWLNANWGSVGVWAVSNGNLIATQNSGSGKDVFCGVIAAVTPAA